MQTRSILWWGKSDPNYSRNRIIRKILKELGWTIYDFHPRISRLAYPEALLKKLPRTSFVWVPVFRQRDLEGAKRWSNKHSIPLLFDPLISAYDKQVYERFKLKPNSKKAGQLLKWERNLFQLPDLVLADTTSHAQYFKTQFGLNESKIKLLYVGAEEEIFKPIKKLTINNQNNDRPLDILFYGSFIPLQGPKTIVEAASLYEGPPATWTMVGNGPLRPECEQLSRTLNCHNLKFENWLDYHEELPNRIAQADLLLGIFGNTKKASRVIPNKVFQSMAMAKPTITRCSSSYPVNISGLHWVKEADPVILSKVVTNLLEDPTRLAAQGEMAYSDYIKHFSNLTLKKQLIDILTTIDSLEI